jgi:predicted TIM-barrel fold metal-dependent hydrolase
MKAAALSCYANIIDADGHILEPPDIWEQYIDPQFRDRALRFRIDRASHEYIEIDGPPPKYLDVKRLNLLGGMGQSEEEVAAALKKTYRDAAPFGAMNPTERVQLLDREGLAATVLYPSLGLAWETELEDPQLAAAHARAYNRWIVDFCADSHGRLVPIAHISLGDGQEAAAELARAVKSGAKGAFVVPFTVTSKAHAHPDYDPFWATAQDLGVPVGIHPTAEPPAKRVYQRFKDVKWAQWFQNVLGGQGPQQAFYMLFQYGLFDRFPDIKIILLESGAGWIGAALDRMDTTYETALGKSVPLKEKPSFHFKRQCWISADPDETTLPLIIEHVGADRFFWATDFPHFDHPSNYLDELARLVAPMSEPARRNILGESVARVYGLS